MNAKYIKNILTATVVAVGSAMVLTSCEDTLEKPSYTADDLDYVFEDLDKAELFVKGCYRGLIHEENYRQYNSGETITIPSEEDLSGSKWMVGNYKFDPIMPAVFGTCYKEGYRIIEACNVGLARIAKFEDSVRKKALMAELYTVRAYAYFTMIRMFGDLPAVFQPLESMDMDAEETFYPKRVSRDIIYDKVIEDMLGSIDNLPWFSESDYGSAPERITRQGAYGLLARICLHAAGYSLRWNLETNDPSTLNMSRREDAARVRELYQIADDALAKVINKGENSLIQDGDGMSATQRLFFNYCQRNFGFTSQEMLFQTAQYGTTTNSSFGVYNGQPGCRGGLYGARKALQLKLPTYYLSFDPADNRRDVSVCNYSITFYKENVTESEWAHISTGFSAMCSGKFRIEWCQEPAAAAQRNLDIPILRYADVLLMYAETQNYLHNGPTQEGINALREVRKRAGVDHLAVPTSQDDFLDAVMQERKWEFADEFLMRADLIRTNLLDRDLAVCKQEMKNLSDRAGKYADVATYRLYKLDIFHPAYGQNFLTLPYIDLTDQEEIDLIKTAPRTSAQIKSFNEKIATILSNHGINDGSTWYPLNMFEAWTSTYNKNCRIAAGFNTAATSVLQLGASIYPSPTGSAENGGQYPAWIEQLFYGYEKNKTELSPFANKSAGHPLVDNPNLTQHPGYLQ